MNNKYRFNPDYTVPTGSTLKEVIESKGMSQSELALRMELTEKTISQIINGTAPITYETASKLELVLGISANFWNKRESQYREALVRIEESKRLETEVEWLKSLPITELVKRGLLKNNSDKSKTVRQMLAFFGVSSVAAWEDVWPRTTVQFRGASAQKKWPGYVAAWLRLGELKAEQIACKPYSASAFRKALLDARNLTIQPSSIWLPKLRKLCADAGVAVVLVKELKKAGVSGITKWIAKDRAMIQLSLRYKRDDQFWFTLFHEACHVLKHSKKIIFYENGDGGSLETEANVFARNFLIPPEHIEKFPFLKSKAKISAFAASISISPGVVVGRLQHDKFLPQSHCNELKKKYDWRD